MLSMVGKMSHKSWVVVGMILVAGCGGEKGSPPAPQTKDKGESTAAKPQAAAEDALHQPFDKATRKAENALPPMQTIGGKSVNQLHTQVVNEWLNIRFVSPEGKKLQYKAVLLTTLGSIEIELWPEVAPNHVRSFVALSRAGFYDELFFEGATSIETNDGKSLPLAVNAGSAAGDGHELSNIGYWLRAEIADPADIRHEAGTLAACHGPDPDTAGCRFYITLSEAPILDGSYTIFGKVTRGLDVVHKIHEHLMREQQATSTTTETPPLIRKVTISVQPLESNGAKSNNKQE